MSDIVSPAMPAGARVSRITAFLPLVAMIAAAIVLRIVGHLNTDVSWLLTLGEKMTSGARPYIDFLEVNPPASIILYLPAILIGHALDIAPETVVNAMVFVATATSLGACASLLRGAGLLDNEKQPARGAIAAFVLLVLPCYTFAQREHIALIAILPLLCVYAARADGAAIGARAASMAGIAAGVAVAIKPHFALALLLPFSCVLWKQRRDRAKAFHLIFAAENLAVLGIVLAYAALVFWAFPAFLKNELPLVTTLYTKVSQPLLLMLRNPSCILFAAGIAATVWFGKAAIFQPLNAVPLLAAFGFILAAIVQSKGVPYHGYPAIALTLLVAGNLLVTHGASRASAVMLAFYIGLAAASAYWFSVNAEIPGLLEAIRSEPVSRPKLLAIAGDIGIGHPLTRQLNGSWAGTACSLWVTQYADRMLSTVVVDAETARMLARYKAFDRNIWLRDIKQNKPDIVLIDGPDWHRWAMANPMVRASLGDYRRDKTVGGVEIWLRKALVPKARAAL